MKHSVFLLITRGLAAALALGVTQFASAHAHPKHETPAANSTISEAPKEVAMDFDDALEPSFSSIAVADASDKLVTGGKSVVDASNPKHMSVPVKTLSAGVYKVSWVAVAADGHRTQGHYSFTVKSK